MLDGTLDISPKICECCKQYDILYDSIKREGMRWLTISPKYSFEEPQKDFESMLDAILEMISKDSLMLGVAEMSEQLRLHYHIVYSAKDKIKEYKVLNKIRQISMLRVYNGEPKGGIDYLFKDVVTTRAYINEPVFTHKQLLDLRFYRKMERKIKKQQDKERNIERKNTILDYIE